MMPPEQNLTNHNDSLAVGAAGGGRGAGAELAASPRSGERPSTPAPRPPHYDTASGFDPRLIKIGLALLVVLIVGVLVFFSLRDTWHQNSYGQEIRISNFSRYFPKVSEERRDHIYSVLYNAVAESNPDDDNLPTSGAEIRDGSLVDDLSDNSALESGEFIVDIPALEQSYRIFYEWPIRSTSGGAADVIIASCPLAADQIYQDEHCVDESNGDETAVEEEKLVSNTSIAKYLPIDIDYYDPDTGRYISYRISGRPEWLDGQVIYKIIITDRSGDNYNLALDRIRSLSCGDARCNPADYHIEYIDQSK